MPWTSGHTKWLVDTGERLKTADGKEVEVWEFRHENDEIVLSAWAKHFRNHYCLDAEIDFQRGKRPRQECFWPVDALELAEGLIGRQGALS